MEIVRRERRWRRRHTAKEVDFRTESPRFHETSAEVHRRPQGVEALQLPAPDVGHVRILGEPWAVVDAFAGLTVLEAKVLVRISALHPERRVL